MEDAQSLTWTQGCCKMVSCHTCRQWISANCRAPASPCWAWWRAWTLPPGTRLLQPCCPPRHPALHAATFGLPASTSALRTALQRYSHTLPGMRGGIYHLGMPLPNFHVMCLCILIMLASSLKAHIKACPSARQHVLTHARLFKLQTLACS